MTKADKAVVTWDAGKKTWRVRIEVGEEVIKRPASDRKLRRETDDKTLIDAAIETARADGYEVDPTVISVAR
jgi:hypothetical protein